MNGMRMVMGAALALAALAPAAHASGEWWRVPDYGYGDDGPSHMSAAALHGRVYVSAEQDGAKVYDPRRRAWSRIAQPPQQPEALVAARGRVYALGDVREGRMALTLYDPAANAWSDGPAGPAYRYGFGAALGPDGRIYVLGGSTFDATSGDFVRSAAVETYDPATGRWRAAPPMRVPRGSPATVTGADGRIYAIGGGDRSVEAYTPATRTWQQVGVLPVDVPDPAAALGADGLIYVVGDGCAVHTFDPATGSWGAGGALPTVPHTQHGGVAREDVCAYDNTAAALASGRLYTFTTSDSYWYTPLVSAVRDTLGRDRVAPSAPALSVRNPSPERVNLRWTQATDDVGVEQYEVYRNGDLEAILGPSATAYSDTTTPLSRYRYRVLARDRAGNHGDSPLRTLTTSFSDAFETGDASRWDLPGYGGEEFALPVQRSLVYNGQWAARSTSPPAPETATSAIRTAQATYWGTTPPPGIADLYYRAFVNVQSAGGAVDLLGVLSERWDPDGERAGAPLVTLLRTAGGTLALRGATGAVRASGVALGPRGWHQLQLHVRLSDGLTEVWLDGTRVAALSGTGAVATGCCAIGGLRLGSAATSGRWDVAFDKVAANEDRITF